MIAKVLWPELQSTGLIVAEDAQLRIREVQAFAKSLELEHGEAALGILNNLQDIMSFLLQFSEMPTAPRCSPCRVRLGLAHGLFSFSVVWEYLNERTDKFEPRRAGTLVWHGGFADPLTASVAPLWWCLHT